MKAIRIDAFGPPAEVTRYLEVPEPEPVREGEVLVAVEAAPINPVDLLMMSGVYGALPRLPTIPGKEGVGKVIAVGPGVSGLEVGSRVILPLGCGAWRQRLKVAAESVVPAPLGVDPVQLSMALMNPLTAYLLLHDVVDVQAGEWVLQNAANSSLGRWIIHFAREAGIKTVNVVRREAAIDPLYDLGGNVVLVDGAELPKRITAGTRGAQIRLALDAVAGAGTMRIAACLDQKGTLITYGALSGEPCQLSANEIMFRDIRQRGFWLVSRLREMPAAELRAHVEHIISIIASGKATVPVEATYTLDRIKDAVVHAQREGRTGKIVLLPNDLPSS